MREKGRVYFRGAGTKICVGAWVQWILPLLGVDGEHFESPDDMVCEWNCVGDVFVIVPGNNGSCTKALIDEAGDDPDSILIT